MDNCNNKFYVEEEINKMSEDVKPSEFKTLEMCNNARMVLLPRDPHCLYAYWEIPQNSQNKLKYELGESLWEHSLPVLKIMNISKNTVTYIEINDISNNWFVSVEDANSLYLAEIGRRISDNCFIQLASSNYIYTPNNDFSSNSASYFVDYKDLRHGKFNFESGLIYQSLEFKKEAFLSLGLSSPQVFGSNRFENLMSMSSAELFKINLKQYIGISSLMME